MPLYLLVTFSLFSHLAQACPAAKAQARIHEEAKALNGKIENIVQLPGQTYQCVVRVQIQLWNGRVSEAEFIVDVDRYCQVDVWKVPQP